MMKGSFTHSATSWEAVAVSLVEVKNRPLTAKSNGEKVWNVIGPARVIEWKPPAAIVDVGRTAHRHSRVVKPENRERTGFDVLAFCQFADYRGTQKSDLHKRLRAVKAKERLEGVRIELTGLGQRERRPPRERAIPAHEGVIVVSVNLIPQVRALESVHILRAAHIVPASVPPKLRSAPLEDGRLQHNIVGNIHRSAETSGVLHGRV